MLSLCEWKLYFSLCHFYRYRRVGSNHLYWIERMDWAFDENILLNSCESGLASEYGTSIDYQFDEFLHFGFGCGIVWTAISNHVRTNESNCNYNITLITILPFTVYPLNRIRRLDTWSFGSFNLYIYFVQTLACLRWFVLLSDRAFQLFPSWRICWMI